MPLRLDLLTNWKGFQWQPVGTCPCNRWADVFRCCTQHRTRTRIVRWTEQRQPTECRAEVDSTTTIMQFYYVVATRFYCLLLLRDERGRSVEQNSCETTFHVYFYVDIEGWREGAVPLGRQGHTWEDNIKFVFKWWDLKLKTGLFCGGRVE
jgi:hypothetical protein